jgi:hypothetical protein
MKTVLGRVPMINQGYTTFGDEDYISGVYLS